MRRLWMAIVNFLAPAPKEPPYYIAEKVPYKPGTEHAMWDERP